MIIRDFQALLKAIGQELAEVWDMITWTIKALVDQVGDPANGPVLTFVALVLAVCVALFVYFWKR